MIKFHLFLFLFITIGCTSQIQEKADLLDKELAVTPILSLSFDSLWFEVQKMPSQQQIAILLQVSYRDEKEIDGIKKQESLLLKGINHTSKKEKKKILLQLLNLYKKVSDRRELDIDSKCIQLCETLEKNYKLSQEEKWQIKKTKALSLGKIGLHAQYMPIWFELLAEHRTAQEIKLVIEDLLIIANYFSILDDEEKSISFLNDAYQIANQNHLKDLSNQCLVQLIYIYYNKKQYTEVLNYVNKVGADSLELLIPSIYSIVSSCYLELNKYNDARLYLKKMDHTFKKGNGMILNCRFAETYIAENKIDSALLFLDKAMNLFQNESKLFQKKGIKASLPFYFLSAYSSLATLYQLNTNYIQANESFALVEPLMKKTITNPIQLEMQIDALTRYSTFCRNTKQYKKAVDLMVYRDSIQQIVNKANKERDNKNLMDRLQISDLMHTINMKEIQLANSKRWLIAISCCAFLAVFLITAIIYIIYQHRKQKSVIVFAKNEKKHLQSSTPLEDKEIPDAVEQRFLKIQDRVISEQLFLDKKVTLKSLAKILNTNRSNLSAWINTYAGVNFNQWINDFRINYMLERIHSGKKISILAEEAGFISSDSFYRNFKRKTNLTPTEYLKQNPPR